jgi:hypothetical protein
MDNKTIKQIVIKKTAPAPAKKALGPKTTISYTKSTIAGNKAIAVGNKVPVAGNKAIAGGNKVPVAGPSSARGVRFSVRVRVALYDQAQGIIVGRGVKHIDKPAIILLKNKK